jgi:phage terminase small subunit
MSIEVRGMAERKLTPKQNTFIYEYMTDSNATRAYRAAYPTCKLDTTARANGCLLLATTSVQAAIAELQHAAEVSSLVTVNRVILELARMGFSNMDDYVTRQPDGSVFIDLSNATRDQMAAVQEITIDEYIEGRGENAREVKKIKLKLADKRGPLELIARHIGMLIERREVTGRGGGPIDLQAVGGMDDTELDLRIQRMLAEAAADATKRPTPALPSGNPHPAADVTGPDGDGDADGD